MASYSSYTVDIIKVEVESEFYVFSNWNEPVVNVLFDTTTSNT